MATQAAQFQAPIVTDQKPEGETPPDYVPAGYKDAEEYLEYMREGFHDDLSADQKNRDMAIEDLQFIAGEQWDPMVRAARKGRPCPTINTLPQFIGQVIGDHRMNETSIKVDPVTDASQEDAQNIAGIVKGIEYRSRAKRARDMAVEHQISCGVGYTRIYMDYADDDAFDQDIFIGGVPNPLSIVMDRFSVDPTGRDADRCWVEDMLDMKLFEKEYPDKTPEDSVISSLSLMASGWVGDKNNVRVTEFWEMIYEPKVIALFGDGSIQDVTGKNLQDLARQGKLLIDPVTQQPRVREGQCRYARMHLVTGNAILSGPFTLPINRLPIIRYEGRIVPKGDERYRYSLIRWMKEPARMRNYWRGTMIESLAMAPKAKYVGEDAAFEGYVEDWRNAHLTNDPVLMYKAGQKPPQQIPPPPIDAALLQQVQMNTQDLKDTSGLQDASLGIKSNEVSGVAIQGRQQEGDVATFMYHDNANSGILEEGDVVVQLLPVCYDTTRTLLTIGMDNKRSNITVNNPADPNGLDLSRGKYTVAVEAGPSFTTQRQQGAQAMMEMIKVAPDIMTLAADLIAKYQDFPGAIEIAERLNQSMVQKGIITPDGDQGAVPLTPQLAQQIKQEAISEFMQSVQGQQVMTKLRLENAQADQAEAMAEEARHKADKADIEATTLASTMVGDVVKSVQPDAGALRGNNNGSGARPRAPANKKQPSKGNRKKP